MGTSDLLSLGQLLPKFQQSLFTSRRAPALPGSGGISPAEQASGRAKQAVTGNGASKVANETRTFDNFTYQRQIQRVALNVQFQEAAARIAKQGEDNPQSAEAYANQLTFSFFFEAQQEQLAIFNERTGKVAEGLDEARRQSFVATRERIAFPFSFSGSISASALGGFANGAENSQHDGNTFDKLVQAAGYLLDESNDVFSQLFELLNGFFKSEGDFQTRFNELLSGLQQLGLVNGAAGAGSGGAAPAGTAQFVQASRTEVNFQFEFSFVSESIQVQQADPLVLDLDGDGVELTSAYEGARFDITASGRMSRTAFVTGGDAFLAVDRNGNGIIDDASELFGDQTGFANGFEALRVFDSNNDGQIDAQDDAFDSLFLFRDNGNGKTEAGELLSLAQAGISSLSLNYQDVDLAAAGGNRIAQVGEYRRADGTTGVLADALLNYLA
jgi:hypothetical protein